MSDAISESDLSYRTRLWAVYTQLRDKSALLAPLPAWANSYLLGISKDAAIEQLREIPRLQAALAGITSYTPSKWLLEQELSKRKTGADDPALTAPAVIQPPPGANAQGWWPSWIEGGQEDVFDAAAREKMYGLCLSGGGIRSATFSLGILEALAEQDRLKKFTYLSTVSGGGYIHQWLASWIYRDDVGLANVTRQMVPLPETGSQARAPEQISWLRRYSSYLTPQRGIFSADTWTMIAIWARNTFLNQIVLFGFLASCIWALRGITYPFVKAAPFAMGHCARVGLLFLLALPLLIMAAWSSHALWRALASVTAPVKQGAELPKGSVTDAQVFCKLVLPGFAFSLLIVLTSLCISHNTHHTFLLVVLGCWAIYLLGLLMAVTFGGRAPQTSYKLRTGEDGWSGAAASWLSVSLILCAAVSVAAATGLTRPLSANTPLPGLQPLAGKAVDFLMDHLGRSTTLATFHQELKVDGKSQATLDLRLKTTDQKAVKSQIDSPKILTIFAPVIIFFLQFLAIRLQLGIIGRFYTESRREWLARFGAWAAILSVGWIALSALALIGPSLFHWFFDTSTLKQLGSAIGVVALHSVTLSAGASGKTSGDPKSGSFFGYSALDMLGLVGAPLCLLSLLVIVSGCVDKVVNAIANNPDKPNLGLVALAALGTVGITALFGIRVDVNAFSMHGFYRDRLARCYLGATNPMRTPDPFTGFDDHAETGTGIQLSDLVPICFGGDPHTQKPAKPTYDGPFPIFCSTINLTFGEDLATQERKGASFAFTPLYTGYHVGWTGETDSGGETTFNGFVPTDDFAYTKGGIGLAATTAICGAALSPNQGFSSQPALAFLMTLFNVRLGWWIANPRKPKIWPSINRAPTPLVGLTYLLNELFGLADDTSNYVCLCDGGRFEDMGMYELVRRRCRLIIVCDGEQENGDYEGIGGAISKCRTDFGAEIDLDLHPIIPDPLTGRSASHFCVGTIRYPAPPGKTAGDDRYTGNIIYFKTTYVGDEPGDILHHKKADPAFPQDSTLNQWFTESDFESYRRLGQLTAKGADTAITDCENAIAAGKAFKVPVPHIPVAAPTLVTLVPPTTP